MPIRLFLAFFVGLAIYMIAMMMTVYDGFPSLILQPLFAVLTTLFSILIVVIAGWPFVFSKLWKWWTKRWWLSVTIIALSLLALFLSYYPGFRVMVYVPEIEGEIESFHPVLGLTGWFGVLFGITWMPLLSIRNLVWMMKKRLNSA